MKKKKLSGFIRGVRTQTQSDIASTRHELSVGPRQVGVGNVAHDVRQTADQELFVDGDDHRLVLAHRVLLRELCDRKTRGKWREDVGGHILAGTYWREDIDEKILAGRY